MMPIKNQGICLERKSFDDRPPYLWITL